MNRGSSPGGASVVSMTSASGCCTAVAMASNLGLVGFVFCVGTLEAGHEGWFCSASFAGAAAEHFDVVWMLLV